MDAFPQQSGTPTNNGGAAAGGAGGFGAFGPGGEVPKRAHLYIGNLSSRVTEYMLQEIFAVAGPVQGVKIIPDRNFQHGGANYGFVEYHDLRSAETALQTLNGRKIFDQEIRCNWAYQNQTAKEDLTNHCHIFVGDLSPEVTDDILQKAFAAFGTLSDARVMWDMNSGKSRGYGFLAFRDKTDAEQAIAAMNGEWLGSRAIRVNWANQKNQGMEGGGPGGPAGGMGMGGGGGGGGGGMGMGGGQPPMGSGLPQMPMGGQGSSAQSGGGGGGMNTYGGPPASYEVIVAQTPAFNTTIYVGNLVPYTTQADLIPLFQGFGYIVEIRMQADRGFAFVKLDSHENAALAIVNLQSTPIHGRQLKCHWGKDRMGGDVGMGPGASMGGGAVAPQQQQQQQQPQAQQGGQQGQAGAYGAYGAYAAAPGPQDPAAAAALAAWQAQYGAQYAAYMQQQHQIQQQQQQQQQQRPQ